ncbi:MAG: hypothetical protein QM572_17255 [Nocardioides sp.]|uniref:hypothetical protein n=1 Tax=Nocardioides sp. TaxID=35761 RepID=UPI0039E3DEE8
MSDHERLSEPGMAHRFVVGELSREFDIVSAALIGSRLDESLTLHLGGDAAPAPDVPFVIDLCDVRLLCAEGVRVIEDFGERARASGVSPRLLVVEGSMPYRVLRVLGLLDELSVVVRRRPRDAR